MKSDRSKFFKFLAGLAVSSSIFSSVNVSAAEDVNKAIDIIVSTLTGKDKDPKKTLLGEVKRIFEKNNENCNLDDDILFDAVICLGKVVQAVYKLYITEYVRKYGPNRAPQHIDDKEFKSSVIYSIDLSIKKNKFLDGDEFTKHLENAKKLLNYKSGAELMSELRWRSF